MIADRPDFDTLRVRKPAICNMLLGQLYEDEIGNGAGMHRTETSCISASHQQTVSMETQRDQDGGIINKSL
jgi:hypothetical protein